MARQLLVMRVDADTWMLAGESQLKNYVNFVFFRVGGQHWKNLTKRERQRKRVSERQSEERREKPKGFRWHSGTLAIC